MFSEREEKGIFVPGEIGPQKKEKVDILLEEMNGLSWVEREYFDFRLRHHM